ncbi:MAG TPA: hypothetical protein VFN91_08045 [Myxococcaceae bacterium]|nr:hypothetical protein [Myxococcaceae bacterium]
MAIDNKARTWVQNVAAGFLCVTAAVTFAIAAARPPAQAQTRAESSSGYVPPGMHEAQADKDVGPGSDEAQLVASPWDTFSE